jgi:hypothetical protein
LFNWLNHYFYLIVPIHKYAFQAFIINWGSGPEMSKVLSSEGKVLNLVILVTEFSTLICPSKIKKNVWTMKCCTIQNKITVCTYDEYNIEYPFIIKVNIIFWKLLTSETFLPDLDPKPVGTSQMLQAGVHFHLLLSAQNLLQLCVEVHCVYPQWIFFQPKMFC